MSTSPASRPFADIDRTGNDAAGIGPAGIPPATRKAAAARQATELLAIRIRADQDVLGRVSAVIAPSARCERTLWLFFLGPDATRASLVVPIDDIPEHPAASMLGNICYVATESVSHSWPGGSLVITLSRPGTLKLTDSDRHILRAFQHGASVHGTPIRMLCLATPQGVRELGPVTPIR